MPSDLDYHRKYQAAHREQYRATFQRWYEKNGAARRAKNRLKIQATARKYYYNSTGQPEKAELEAQIHSKLTELHPPSKGGSKRRLTEAENKERRKASQRKLRYKLAEFKSLDDYISPERCEVCDSTKKICLDHDHVTGAFRGWLCDRCNRVLGAVKDSPEILQNVIAYIQRKEHRNIVKAKHNIVLCK